METTLTRDNTEKCNRELARETDPVSRFKFMALKRGTSTIKSIGKSFKIMDDDGSRRLGIAEFKKGCREWGITLTKEEFDILFERFDKNGDGNMDYEEFLAAIRPPMSDSRKKVVRKAFIKIIEESNKRRKELWQQQQTQQQQEEEDTDAPIDPEKEVITCEDLALLYKFNEHPKYKNGEMTKKQVLQQFLNNFQPGDKDDKITLQEFMDYYAAVGLSIDTDAGFSFMIQSAWGVSPVDSLA